MKRQRRYTGHVDVEADTEEALDAAFDWLDKAMPASNAAFLDSAVPVTERYANETDTWRIECVSTNAGVSNG